MREHNWEREDLNIDETLKEGNGGHYNKITINGSGTLFGDTVCETIRINGNGNIHGRIDSEGTTIKGMANFSDDVNSKKFTVKGGAKILGFFYSNEVDVDGYLIINRSTEIDNLQANGDVTCKEDIISNKIEINGRLLAEEDISAKKIECNGLLKAIGDCKADELFCVGILTVDRTLQAKKVSFEIEGMSKVNKINANNIECKNTDSTNFFRQLFHSFFGAKKVLHVKEIEGKHVFLENTVCEVVVGDDIIIGKGCKIDKIEYTGSLEIHDKSVVNEITKLNQVVSQKH